MDLIVSLWHLLESCDPWKWPPTMQTYYYMTPVALMELTFLLKSRIMIWTLSSRDEGGSFSMGFKQTKACCDCWVSNLQGGLTSYAVCSLLYPIGSLRCSGGPQKTPRKDHWISMRSGLGHRVLKETTFMSL